uniref:Uncharacterized protein n=1 Tax=Clastoptera arizonana TaxID=38151 RepID=A0A1B6EGQ1_9HEMI
MEGNVNSLNNIANIEIIPPCNIKTEIGLPEESIKSEEGKIGLGDEKGGLENEKNGSQNEKNLLEDDKIGLEDDKILLESDKIPLESEKIGLEEGNNSNVEGSEEVTPSLSGVDEQPVNPWSSVKCIFCDVLLSSNEEPKLLECLHASCSSCVVAKLKEQPAESEVQCETSTLVCPVCRVLCRGSNIIENHFLVERCSVPSNESEDASKQNELKCGSCPETVATSWCVECAEYICEGCVQAHQRLKITKEHTIKPKEEGEAENQSPAPGSQHKSLFCSVHRQERLSLFCETCDRLTCRDCQLSDHREHKYKFINEIAAETRSMISGLLSEVSYKRVLLKSALKVIGDRQSLIMEKKKQLVKEITQMVVKLTNTINARGKQLVVRLNEVCDGKQKTLNEKKLALEQLSSLTDHCIDFVNNALNQGSDMALLFSKTSVTNHLQRIKSRRADIPNPEIPVRINLSLDKVSDLIKGMIPIKSHPSGTVHHLHHQQVTSSTHPYNNGGHHVEPNLRGLLAHHNFQQQPPIPYTTIRATSPQAAIAGPSMPLYRMTTTGQLPPPLPPSGSSSHQRYMNNNHHPHTYTQSMQQGPQVSQHQHHHHQVTAPSISSLLQSSRHHPSAYSPAARQLVQRVQSPHSSNQQSQPTTQVLSWHIPQQPHGNYSTVSVNNNPKPQPPHLVPMDESFKITLKQQVRQNSEGTPPAMVDVKPPHPSYVTSSVSKTPSPHTQAKAADDAEKSLDKFCQESVNDLMMTIAKLDSNGIMVIPEKGADSLVDSSTGPPMDILSQPSTSGVGQQNSNSQGILDSNKDDPNEDWCAVCLDGGEPVLCCDNCPKVFHLKCHIPSLSAFPGESESWQCLLCTSMSSVTASIAVGEKRPLRHELDSNEQKLMERILLELYCQYEPSLHFREVVSLDNFEYYEKIKKPMSFEIIRHKLSGKTSDRYRSMQEVVNDIRLVFKNAYLFNPRESQIYSDAKSLEEFLDMLLEKWVPSLAYDDSVIPVADDDCSEPKRLRRTLPE